MEWAKDLAGDSVADSEESVADSVESVADSVDSADSAVGLDTANPRATEKATEKRLLHRDRS